MSLRIVHKPQPQVHGWVVNRRPLQQLCDPKTRREPKCCFLYLIKFISANNLPNLIIAGWNGTQWVEIPSSVDAVSILGGASTLASGSITTTSEVNLATYQYFTLAGKDGCAPLIASSGNTKTWNGTWSPSEPTLADPVVINSPYSGSLVANSLQLNNNITLADGETVEIVNGVTGTGKIIMSSEAVVVQRNSISAAPNIELTKTTRAMRRYDYVYWGTPIAGNFFSQLNGAVAQGYATTGAFDQKFKFVPGPAPGNGCHRPGFPDGPSRLPARQSPVPCRRRPTGACRR